VGVPVSTLENTPQAWERIIKRKPKCVEWSEKEVRQLVPDDKIQRTLEIRSPDHRLRIDAVQSRPRWSEEPAARPGDSAIGIVSENEKESLLPPRGFHRTQLEAARKAGAKIGLIFFGRDEVFSEIGESVDHGVLSVCGCWRRFPKNDFLLEGVNPSGSENAAQCLSTCTMVRLGRVMAIT